jgi:hypothetical protein
MTVTLEVDEKDGYAMPLSTDSRDDACPSCGQPLWIDGRFPPPQSSQRPWWPLLFVGIGLYVAFVFSWRIWQALAEMPSPAQQSSCELARMAGHDHGACAEVLHAAGIPTRSLTIAAVAGVMVVLGASQLARQVRRDPFNAKAEHGSVPERRSATHLVIAKGLQILSFAEAPLVPFFQVLIAVATVFLVTALVQGGYSPGDAFNSALDRVYNVVALANVLPQR